MFSGGKARLMPHNGLYTLVIATSDDARLRSLLDMVNNISQSALFEVTSLSGAARVAEFFAQGKEKGVDIFMTDIEFGEGAPTGVDYVQRYFSSGADAQIIYFVDKLELVSAAYRTEHVYMMAQPPKQEDLEATLSKAVLNVSATATPPLAVRSEGRIVRVDPREITHIESKRRKAVIYTGGEQLETYASLAGLLESLPGCFVQCHKSFLVNLSHVAELQRDGAVLFSDEVVPVSKKRRTVVKDAFKAHLNGLL